MRGKGCVVVGLKLEGGVAGQRQLVVVELGGRRQVRSTGRVVGGRGRRWVGGRGKGLVVTHCNPPGLDLGGGRF